MNYEQLIKTYENNKWDCCNLLDIFDNLRPLSGGRSISSLEFYSQNDVIPQNSPNNTLAINNDYIFECVIGDGYPLQVSITPVRDSLSKMTLTFSEKKGIESSASITINLKTGNEVAFMIEGEKSKQMISELAAKLL